MNEDDDRRQEVHPIPWMGEGTVPDVSLQDDRRSSGLLRFAAGTAAVALALGVGGGLAFRSLGEHQANATVTSPTTGQHVAPAPAPAPGPAPTHDDEAHGDSD